MDAKHKSGFSLNPEPLGHWFIRIESPKGHGVVKHTHFAEDLIPYLEVWLEGLKKGILDRALGEAVDEVAKKHAEAQAPIKVPLPPPCPPPEDHFWN